MRIVGILEEFGRIFTSKVTVKFDDGSVEVKKFSQTPTGQNNHQKFVQEIEKGLSRQD
jgi:hypothetical protein